MRRKKHPGHENLDRWLVSYADFITLLFAFFTTMYAISTVDAKKLGRMVLAMQAAFDDTVQGTQGHPEPGVFNTGFPNGMPGPFEGTNQKLTDIQKRQARMRQEDLLKARQGSLPQIKNDLDQMAARSALSGTMKVSLKTRGVVVSLAEAGFFDSGSAEVRRESLPVLDKMCEYLKTIPNFIRIEGHTDNVPINTPRYPSNFELSTARATTILSYLVKQHGLDAGRLSAAGYGEHHPAETNDTVEGRAHNRRVDVVILSPTAMLSEPAFDESPAATKPASPSAGR